MKFLQLITMTYWHNGLSQNAPKKLTFATDHTAGFLRLYFEAFPDSAFYYFTKRIHRITKLLFFPIFTKDLPQEISLEKI